MFNVGPLDRRLEVQRKTSTQDGTFGSKKSSWETYTTIWANVQDQLPSKAESVVVNKEVAINKTRIRIRWNALLLTTDRFKLGDRIFQIVGGGAEIGGRAAFLEFMCEEVKP